MSVSLASSRAEGIPHLCSSLPFRPPRGTEKEWPREMRKQIEFSKTIARRGAVVEGGGSGGSSGGARHLQVRGRFTSGGQAGTDRAEGRWRGYEGKIKEGAGGKLERRRGHGGQINDEDGGKRIVALLVSLIRSFIRAITSQPSVVHVVRSERGTGRIGVECNCRTKWEVFLVRYRWGLPGTPERNPPCLHSYGNAYTSTLVGAVSRTSCPENAIGFPSLSSIYGSAWSLPVHRVRALLHSHLGANSNRFFLFYLCRTTLNSFTRIDAHTFVHRATIYPHRTHPHDYRGSMWRRASVIICVYTSPRTHMYCSPTVKCTYICEVAVALVGLLSPTCLYLRRNKEK